MDFQSVMAIVVGIALAAAVGLRIFVPFFVMSLAAKSGALPLAPGFDWIGTTPATVLFGVATLVEVLAYYVPWLDNALDAVGPPVAVAAGIVASASVMVDLPPLFQWCIAVIAGGSAAAILHGATAVARAGSTLATGGSANFVLATAELAGSIITSVLAILVPLAALLAAVILAAWLLRRRARPVPS